MKRSFFGIARNFNQANTLVRRLREVGFETREISVLAPEIGGGSQIGGVLSLLAEVGPLPIPRLGPFIAAGPLKAALSKTQLDQTTGGLLGSLVALKVPKIEAAVYEEKLGQGSYLISVFANENRDVERARETFRNSGAEDLCVADESTGP